jgi:RecB family exonuclease
VGVEALTRLPAPRQRQHATPSSAPIFLQCWLRVAYASDPAFRAEVPGSPAARLGTACHQVLELAGAGALPPPSEPAWPEAFEAAWNQAIAAEEESARKHPLESHLPPASRWPGYAMRKVRTRKLAAKLGASAPKTARAPGAEVQLEQEHVGFEGKLRGRPDIVRKTADGTAIEDFKTGSLYEAESGELKEGYRLQLLLYAALAEEGESEGTTTSAKLIPLEGEPAQIEIEGTEAAEAAGAVIAAMDGYNQAVATGASPQDLASPEPGHCRFCPFAVRCPAFWASITPEWSTEGILAVAGQVKQASASRFGTFNIEAIVEAGSSASDTVTLHGLPFDRFGPAAAAAPGSSIAATGLRPGAQPGVLRPTLRTRLIAQSNG